MVDGGDGNACVALSTVGLSVTTEASAAASSSSRSENGWSSSSFAAMPRRGRWMRIWQALLLSRPVQCVATRDSFAARNDGQAGRVV